MGWGLAPLLAIAAIGVQFAIDVPHHEMIEREPKTEKKAKKSKTTTAARTRRSKKAKRKQWRPRGAAYTKRLRETWSHTTIVDEPKDPRFAVHHEALLRALARKAEAAVAPANEAVNAQVQATCHTIRCDFQVCAPAKLAEGIAERVPEFTIGRRPLWHELRDVPPHPARSGQLCYRWIVDFAIEGPNIRSLNLPG